MAEDAIAKARAIAARLSAAAAPSGDVLGKRKSRWGDEESKWGWGDGAGNVHSGGEMRKKKKVYIPVDKYPDINFMGLLIGPRGSNQKRMEEGSGAKILIRGKGSSKDNDPEEESEDLHVEISAPSDESLNKAQELVEEILFNPERAMEIKRQQLRQVAEMNGTLHEGPGSGHGGDPEYESAEITVPRGMVGYVIGRGGETIRDLQSRSGAHVQVVRELEGSNAADRTISVSGSKDAVQRATKMINDLINEKANGNSGGGGRDGSHYGPGGDPNALLIAVPNEKVGLIIGKGGSTVRALQQRTGANLSIPDSCDPENPSQRLISVSGTEQAKEDAKNEILAIVEDPNQGQSITFPIPNDKVGLVIGRRGDTIRGIQERTQAKINIPPQPDAGSNPPVRTVSVAGSQQAVEMAKYELESILAGNGPSGGGRDNNQRQQYGHGHGHGHGYGQGHGHGHGHGQYHPHQQQQQQQHQQQQQYSAYYDANGNPTGYYDQYGQYHYYSQQQQQPHHQQQYYGQEYGQDPNGAASGAVSGATSAPPSVSGAAPDSTTSTATTNAPADGSGAATSASATDPNSYWNGYYEYAAYYGVDAANKAWGVAQPATGADSAPGTDPAAGTVPATAPAPDSEGDSTAPKPAEVAQNSDSAPTQEQSTEQSQDQGDGSTPTASATEPSTTQSQSQSQSQYYAQYGGQYGQGQYGQPQYGQPQYGQPQYSQGQYAQGQYGQPQHDQGQYAQPQYSQGQYGAQPGGESSETCAPADSESRADGANSNPSSHGTSEPSA